MKTIAVIDDDLYIGNLVEEVLRQAGYGVLRAYSGTEAALLLTQKRPDLVLLDLMLPGMSGEEVLPLLRGIPVIVVSAKIAASDRVKLLRAGAADYMTKPFDLDELLARIDVQFRRADLPPNAALRVGELSLDPVLHQAGVCGTPVRLTKTEFAILKLLMQNPGQVLAKSTILEHISTDTPDCVESSLKVHISNLRKKLKDVSGADYIEAVWGIGFRLTP